MNVVLKAREGAGRYLNTSGMEGQRGDAARVQFKIGE